MSVTQIQARPDVNTRPAGGILLPSCPQCQSTEPRKSYTLWHERLSGKGHLYYCKDCTLHFFWNHGKATPVMETRYCRCGTDMDRRAPKTAFQAFMRFLGFRLYTCRRCGKRRFRP